MLNISFHNESLQLLPQRALYRPRNKTLYVADTHWGKVATFQARRIPLPDGGLADDLRRLGDLITESGAERLVVLGDLIHSQFSFSGQVLDILHSWREHYHAIQIDLIEGNHDRYIRLLPPDLHIRRIEPGFVDEGIHLHHEPLDTYATPHFCGHLHPGWRLTGKGAQPITLPSFIITGQQLLFPAFGRFTGLMCRYPRRPDQVYGLSEQKVYVLKN